MAAYADCGSLVFKMSNQPSFTPWETFLKLAFRHENTKITIIHFTVEGDPIIYSLYYDGIYTLMIDNTKDQYCSNTGITKLIYASLNQFTTNGGYEWVLKDCLSKGLTNSYDNLTLFTAV